MKLTRNFCSAISLTVFALLFGASATQKPIERISSSNVAYEKVDKNTTPTPLVVNYTLPVFKLLGQTTQNQTIGGVTILCEVNSFQGVRKTTEEKEIVTADPNKPGYDIYRVTTTPFYETKPDQVVFNIKVVNNMDFPIEFNNVPVIFKMDGIGISLSPEFNTSWKSSIAAGGETTTFSIPGPTKEALENAKTVILQIQNVPTAYDKVNGKLQNFETFKWLFEIKKETITKNETKEYSYSETPIYKEICSKCRGGGKENYQSQCSKCIGTKKLEYIDYKTGKKWIGNCDKCSGNGYIITQIKCSTCEGKGQIAYPKSPPPRITSKVTWTGWKVNITTNPAGSAVAVVDPKTGQYTYAGVSNGEVNWFSSNTATSESFPIMLEYQGKKYKVLPYDEKGKPSAAINVNFLGKSGVTVKGGKIVN